MSVRLAATPTRKDARMTKQHPTRREHVELGADLQNARRALLDAAVLTGNRYPKDSPQAKAAQKALAAIEELRNTLDNASAREIPGEDWSPTIYYGSSPEARAEWLAEHPLDD
jgi:hypothetical protein